MDARAPFGNRALPGIFMRWTRAIVAWMRAQGIPTVGYLDDFFCVLETRKQAEEAMMLLVDFVTFLGFKVNSAKCEGPAQVLEFLGVLLDTSGEVLDDLAVLEQVVRQYNGSRVVLERRLVDPRHFATGTLGFGGVWERLFFMLNWEDLAWLPQRPCFPRRKDCRSSWSITYLELFAVWWALVLWGHRMSGTTVVVRIDNQSAMHQVGSWWGPVAYLPLRRQIFFVCTRHDIRLQPVYINTKDNLLADLLSRLDMPRFLAEHKAFLRADIWRQDRDDWMVCPVRWAALDQEFGPFTVDSCVAVSRANAYCYRSWSAVEDARVQKFDGHNAWGNLPFSIMFAIIKNFLRCKRRQQWGTAACFLVHVWDGVDGWELVKSLPHVFRVVREWKKGTHLFTAPDLRGHGKTAWGPTRGAGAGATAGGGALPGGGPSTGNEKDPVHVHHLLQLVRAAILVGFFGLFRKDNLTTGKAGAGNTRGALVRDDVLFHEDGSVVWIRVRHSKTIQCGERHHWVPLRAVPGSLLCPVRALMRLMERTAGRPGDSALLVMEKVTGRRATVVPMTHHDALVAGIKSLAERVGLDPSSYAGHSLRRGGATAAMRLDVASIYIKTGLDWKSDCFERYCELATEQKLILTGVMAEAAAAADR
eukprot:gene5394-biopygen5398